MKTFWIFVAVAALVGAIVYVEENDSILNVPSGPATDASGNPTEPDYTPGDDPTGLFLKAIAFAEGSKPAWNNPWDLTKSFGFPTVGVANSAGVLKFDTLNHGWGAARAQLAAITGGTSNYYSMDTTIQGMAAKYTGNDNANAWANNAGSFLGVDPSTTTIGDVLQLGSEDSGDTAT